MIPLRRWLRQWSGKRGVLRAGAEAVVNQAFADPGDADVAWLSALSPGNDDDHARWELRYARRALLMHTARRDSLDDHTPALIARVVEERMNDDPKIADSMRDLAFRQFNVRVRSYGLAMDQRSTVPLGDRLGGLLLSLAGAVNPQPADVEGASLLLTTILNESNASLREHFGTVQPPDVIPSVAVQERAAP